MNNEKWLLLHECLSDEENILRWTWCGLFKHRDSALSLLKKNIKRIIDEYDSTFPDIKVINDKETLEIIVTIGGYQRFKLVKLIEDD